MAKVTNQCPVCGSKSKSDEPLTGCPTCGADLTRPGSEVVVMKAHGGFKPADGRIRQGFVYLTNLRLFLVEDKSTGLGGVLGGVGGALVEMAINAGKTANLLLNVPVTDIVDLPDEKVTIVATGLAVMTRTYGKVGVVTVPKRETWRSAIMGAAAGR